MKRWRSAYSEFGGRLLLLLLSASAAADPPDEALLRDPPHDAAHPARVVELTIPSAGERLPGHIYLAAGAGPHPTVVLLHGFPGNEKNLDVAQALRRSGFNALFFHYRGAWGGTGSYRLEHLAEDGAAVVSYLRQPSVARDLRVDPDAISLLGHSLGGYAALAGGTQVPGLRCVMALSPANPGLWKQALEAPDTAVARARLAYADSLFMLEGFSGNALREQVFAMPATALDTTGFGPGLVGKAVLLVVGEDDRVTPAESSFDPVVEAYEAVPDLDLTALKLPGDHSFSWSRLALTRAVLAWVDGRCR